MKNYKYPVITLMISVFCLFTGGCQHTNTFTVEGVIVGAAGQTLYLENTGVSTTIILDSIKLKPDCTFSFKQPQPEYPDFYRLKINNHVIHFTVDSTETITFTADINNFSTSYTVEGSENSKSFKEISLARLDAEREIQKLRDSYGLNLIPDATYQESIMNAVKSYKDVALKYIYGVPGSPGIPGSPVAYFALFQQINGLLLFDLYDNADSKAFAAIATSYKLLYPESPRAKQLEIMALQSQKALRSERQRILNMPNVNEVSYIDIELPDINEKIVKLSDVAVGKAVLVAFTAFQTEWSPSLNVRFADLYHKYKDKGFEIYQVSLDNDLHFWKNVAHTLPWINVHDPQSVYSSIAATYNVRQLPTLYLINSKGILVKRIESVETIESDITDAL